MRLSVSDVDILCQQKLCVPCPFEDNNQPFFGRNAPEKNEERHVRSLPKKEMVIFKIPCKVVYRLNVKLYLSSIETYK